jgi:hypothetical protein
VGPRSVHARIDIPSQVGVIDGEAELAHDVDDAVDGLSHADGNRDHALLSEFACQRYHTIGDGHLGERGVGREVVHQDVIDDLVPDFLIRSQVNPQQVMRRDDSRKPPAGLCHQQSPNVMPVQQPGGRHHRDVRRDRDRGR